ncbi:hypothetical protein EDD16DRAFT_1528146 [Pisolithus croceorrhizus]|nr:hypothetical protein EDD16DRAFT_1528146 [Pisolithus croceorrhizus]
MELLSWLDVSILFHSSLFAFEIPALQHTATNQLVEDFFHMARVKLSAQENDQVSLELVCAVHDKRPLVVGGQQRGVQHDSTWTLASTSPPVTEDGDAQELEGEHYGCYFKRVITSSQHEALLQKGYAILHTSA